MLLPGRRAAERRREAIANVKGEYAVVIKRMTLLARKDGMTVAEFQNYWYLNHVKIVKQMPQLGKYVQNHVIRNITPDIGGPAFTVDGIPELWFKDEDAQNAAFQSSAAKALPDDERNFLLGITILSIDETVVRSGDGGAKVMLLCRNGRGNGASSPGASNSWIEHLADELPGAKGCVVNRVVSTDRRAGVWCEPNPPDVIAELRFDNEKAAEEVFRSAEFERIAVEAEGQGRTLVILLVEEKRIV